MTEIPGEALRVVATIPTDPERTDVSGPALAALAAASREEDACLGYDVYESGTVPGTFVTIEAWTDQAGLDAHMTTGHVADAFDVVAPLLVGELVIHPLTPTR